MGRFAFGSLAAQAAPAIEHARAGAAGPAGLFTGGVIYRVEHLATRLADHLNAFIDLDDRRPMSQRAASGLLARLGRSGKPCPPDLRAVLKAIASPDTAGTPAAAVGIP